MNDHYNNRRAPYTVAPAQRSHHSNSPAQQCSGLGPVKHLLLIRKRVDEATQGALLAPPPWIPSVRPPPLLGQRSSPPCLCRWLSHVALQQSLHRLPKPGPCLKVRRKLLAEIPEELRLGVWEAVAGLLGLASPTASLTELLLLPQTNCKSSEARTASCSALQS